MLFSHLIVSDPRLISLLLLLPWSSFTWFRRWWLVVVSGWIFLLLWSIISCTLRRRGYICCLTTLVAWKVACIVTSSSVVLILCKWIWRSINLLVGVIVIGSSSWRSLLIAVKVMSTLASRGKWRQIVACGTGIWTMCASSCYRKIGRSTQTWIVDRWLVATVELWWGLWFVNLRVSVECLLLIAAQRPSIILLRVLIAMTYNLIGLVIESGMLIPTWCGVVLVETIRPE